MGLYLRPRFFCLSRRELRRTNRCPIPSLVIFPTVMLRSLSRFTGSSAPAEILPAASGRCRRCVRTADVAQAPESCGYAGSRFLRAGCCIRYAEAVRHRPYSFFVVLFRTAFPSFPTYLSVRPITEWRERDAVLFHFRSNGSHRGRFRLLFIASSSTVFPFSSPYTTPAVTGGGQERDAVLSLFRWDGFRVGLSERISGKCAALAGFREGGRKGKPMPPLSLFSSYTSSGRKGRDEKRYIQFKSRPSDRRHAYF